MELLVYDMQLKRVKERDKSKGKESTDVGRFDEIYHYFNKKNLDGYVVIETDKLNPREVADLIFNTIA